MGGLNGHATASFERKPPWLKVKLPGGSSFVKVKGLIEKKHLSTVCESAHCPNIGECWSRQTATFMILGDQCTRNCSFCAVSKGLPQPLDADEPRRVAEAVEALDLQYVVVTSVTRDDLDDGGAAHFVRTVQEIRSVRPQCKIELLIPDFQGSRSAMNQIIDIQPDILNHNIETIPRLYPTVRPQADYQRSLIVLNSAHQGGLVSKSGLMVGLGETTDEIFQVMGDLLDHNCRRLTIGQYLQPSRAHLPVVRYVKPEEFEYYKVKGREMGFRHVESGPLVRSSYHADEQARA